MGTFAINIDEHHWLANTDPEQDLCSHGRVFVGLDGQPVVAPDDGEFTLSAAALYLLRTHEGDSVRLHDLRAHPALDAARDVNATIPIEQYRKAVGEFANAVWSLFDGSPKRITDSEDRSGYAAFSEEFQGRLRLATTGSRTPGAGS